jgi:hypothetical protein
MMLPAQRAKRRQLNRGQRGAEIDPLSKKEKSKKEAGGLLVRGLPDKRRISHIR